MNNSIFIDNVPDLSFEMKNIDDIAKTLSYLKQNKEKYQEEIKKIYNLFQDFVESDLVTKEKDNNQGKDVNKDTSLNLPFVKKYLNINSEEEKEISNKQLAVVNKAELQMDILDLSSVIDFYAELKAVENFEEEMARSKNTNLFWKIKWFFRRSFQRMWRDAWIDAKKRIYIKDIKNGLENWEYKEEFLLNHIKWAEKWIIEKSYLNYEKIDEKQKVPNKIQEIVDKWLDDKQNRSSLSSELKTTIEKYYPKITADLSQLEKSLLRLEKAKLENDIKTFEAKLNIFDIGRLEKWYLNREDSIIIKWLDNIHSWINKLPLPNSIKKYVFWILQHPNTWAILSALATRSVTTASYWAWLITWLLIPITIWSIVWWKLAQWRAHREMRDRMAQVDRRWAIWYSSWSKETDWKSFNYITNNSHYQLNVDNIYEKITDYSLFISTIDNYIIEMDESLYNYQKKQALRSWINYLMSHKIWRENNLNMLSYNNDMSVSFQHVRIISLLNKLFPWLVKDFNEWNLLNNDKYSIEDRSLFNEVYSHIYNTSHIILDKNRKNIKKYSNKQWVIYTGVSMFAWMSLWMTIKYVWEYISNLNIWWWNIQEVQNVTQQKETKPITKPNEKIDIDSWIKSFWWINDNVLKDNSDLKIINSETQDLWIRPTEVIRLEKYPDNLVEYNEVIRKSYDNKLWDLVHLDWNWWWNVTQMLWKTSYTEWNYINISPEDFEKGNIQALITPKSWWSSFLIEIDWNWNLLIPDSMKEAFESRSFKYLQIWHINFSKGWVLQIETLATVRWRWNMLFEKIIEQKERFVWYNIVDWIVSEWISIWKQKLSDEELELLKNNFSDTNNTDNIKWNQGTKDINSEVIQNTQNVNLESNKNQVDGLVWQFQNQFTSISNDVRNKIIDVLNNFIIPWWANVYHELWKRKKKVSEFFDNDIYDEKMIFDRSKNKKRVKEDDSYELKEEVVYINETELDDDFINKEEKIESLFEEEKWDNNENIQEELTPIEEVVYGEKFEDISSKNSLIIEEVIDIDESNNQIAKKSKKVIDIQLNNQNYWSIYWWREISFDNI